MNGKKLATNNLLDAGLGKKGQGRKSWNKPFDNIPDSWSDKKYWWVEKIYETLQTAVFQNCVACRAVEKMFA